MTSPSNIFSDSEQKFHDNMIPRFNAKICNGFPAKLTNEFIVAMVKFLDENGYLKDGKIHFSYIKKYSEKFDNELKYVVFPNASVTTETFELQDLINSPSNFTSEAIIRAIAYRVLF